MPPPSTTPLARRLSLASKVAVVTGGHRGIGAAITIALAEQGCDVIVIDRGGAASSPVPAVLAGLGREHHAITADISSAAAARAAAAAAAAAVAPRRVSILVNNAGVAHLGPAHRLPDAAWDATFAVNTRAPFVLAQALFDALAAEKGCVINVSSAAGGGALEDHVAYCASKAALDMMTKVLALEWGAEGVRVNGVAPTVVKTEMGARVWTAEKSGPMLARIPLGRFAEADEVADAVVFLASEASSMITGQVVSVDGGFNVG